MHHSQHPRSLPAGSRVGVEVAGGAAKDLEARHRRGVQKRLLLALEEIDLLSSELPGETLVRATWQAATHEQQKEIGLLLQELWPSVGQRVAEVGAEEAWVEALEVVVAIYEVLPFGWSGSPGHFTAWAMAAEVLTQTFIPKDPRAASWGRVLGQDTRRWRGGPGG